MAHNMGPHASLVSLPNFLNTKRQNSEKENKKNEKKPFHVAAQNASPFLFFTPFF